jgi:hypothetical protein
MGSATLGLLGSTPLEAAGGPARAKAARAGVDGVGVDRVDVDRVFRLLGDLDEDDYDVRQRADERLRALGPAVLPWLQDEYERNPSLEVRDRVRRMIRDLQKGGAGDHSNMR